MGILRHECVRCGESLIDLILLSKFSRDTFHFCLYNDAHEFRIYGNEEERNHGLKILSKFGFKEYK